MTFQPTLEPDEYALTVEEEAPEEAEELEEDVAEADGGPAVELEIHEVDLSAAEKALRYP